MLMWHFCTGKVISKQQIEQVLNVHISNHSILINPLKHNFNPFQWYLFQYETTVLVQYPSRHVLLLTPILPIQVLKISTSWHSHWGLLWVYQRHPGFLVWNNLQDVSGHALLQISYSLLYVRLRRSLLLWIPNFLPYIFLKAKVSFVTVHCPYEVGWAPQILVLSYLTTWNIIFSEWKRKV